MRFHIAQRVTARRTRTRRRCTRWSGASECIATRHANVMILECRSCHSALTFSSAFQAGVHHLATTRSHSTFFVRAWWTDGRRVSDWWRRSSWCGSLCVFSCVWNCGARPFGCRWLVSRWLCSRSRVCYSRRWAISARSNVATLTAFRCVFPCVWILGAPSLRVSCTAPKWNVC